MFRPTNISGCLHIVARVFCEQTTLEEERLAARKGRAVSNNLIGSSPLKIERKIQSVQCLGCG